MPKSLQGLMLVGAIIMALRAVPAMAQTVVVKAAPAGAPIDLVVNSGSPQSATADASGNARLTVSMPAGVDASGVRFYIETCAPRVRVVMVTVGMAVPTAECLRTDIPWLFVMRPETSFLVDLEGSSPMVLLRQGSLPRQWMLSSTAGPVVDEFAIRPPTGLVLSGQAGLGGFRNILGLACGNAACSGDNVKGNFGGAVTVWWSPYLGTQIGFAKPSSVKAAGSGTGFSFNSALDARVVTVAANLGKPVGRARPYGQFGVNHHQALFSQTNKIDDTTITVNGVPTTVTGGTQTSRVRTTGWGWLFGAGTEVWLSHSIGVYAEGQFAWLNGADTAGGTAKTDDYLTIFMVGGRWHFGR
jgi:hypothetical protein